MILRACLVCGLAASLLSAQEPDDAAEALAKAKQAFLAGDYRAVVDAVRPALAQEAGPAHLLAADALFALGDPESLAEAKTLYERCLYETTAVPFDDHSYYQLSRIFMIESATARERGALFDALELEGEARFYLNQLLKKYPASYYRDRGRSALFDVALAARDYEDAREQALAIGGQSEDPELLARVEPFLLIDREGLDAAEIRAMVRDRQATIRRFPELMAAYAGLLERAGDLSAAGDLYLETLNLWPNRADGARSLLRLADLRRRAADWDAARFLYVQAIEGNPNTLVEARAALALAEMIETGALAELEINQQKWGYRDLVDLIRHSPLDDPIRARYSYQLALYETVFGNVERALVVLQNLRNDYVRGPFLGLYRDFYEKLLFTVIDRKYNAGDDWGLDRLYRQHRPFLGSTPQTAYPEKIAKAYLRLGLPSSAIQVYESMWNYKLSIAGFELAFEGPLTDSLELLNAMRQDSRLASRLRDYETLYGPSDRARDRFRCVKTLYESRALPPEQFLEGVKNDGEASSVASIYDARRLRRVAVVAQELGDAEYAESAYAALSGWTPLRQEAPALWREAALFKADRLYSLGNYFEAERRYAAIWGDDSFEDADRNWAYLQMARLNELAGNVKPSLRMYGQIIYAGEESGPWRAFASRRLAALAAERRLAQLEEELQSGGR